jgi:hypothetical protein
VDKGYFVLAGRFSQVDEHFRQWFVPVVTAYNLWTGSEHGEAEQQQNSYSLHISFSLSNNSKLVLSIIDF